MRGANRRQGLLKQPLGGAVARAEGEDQPVDPSVVIEGGDAEMPVTPA